MKIIKTPKIWVFLAVIVMSLASQHIYAQEATIENEYNTWAEFKVSKKISPITKIFLAPEIRFDNTSGVDKFLMETGVKYNVLSFLRIGASYRFTANIRDTKSTEYLHRYAFDATAKTKFRRVEPEFRLQYTNYANTDEDSGINYLRYKSLVAYDIPKSKLTPFISAEAFHSLSESKFDKVRYTIGVDHKLFKNNYVGLDYKLDYYIDQFKNRHTIGISYKLKL